MSTVSGLDIANQIEREWRDRLEAAVKAERDLIAKSLERQADLATDALERKWALQMAAKVRARSSNAS